MKANHWECEVKETVAPHYFSPPPFMDGSRIIYSAQVTAFYQGKSFLFRRTYADGPWKRIK